MIHSYCSKTISTVAVFASVGGRDVAARFAWSGAAVMAGGTVVGDRRVVHVGTGKAVGGVACIALN